MNPTLKNNQRVTYLRDLPSAVALHNYIQELDTKYNVNSKDHENSFGDITLDNPIIKNGVSNTLYFAKISTSGFSLKMTYYLNTNKFHLQIMPLVLIKTETLPCLKTPSMLPPNLNLSLLMKLI